MVLVCDFFGVVVSEILPIWFKVNFGDEYGVFLKEKYSRLADVGDVSYSGLLKMVCQDFSLDEQQVDKEWMALAKPNPQMVEFLKEYTRPVVLLSNAPEGLVERILEKYTLDYLFSQKIISYRCGISKPDERIYKIVADLYPEECFLFVDDNVNNLVIPKSFGWDTLLYDNTPECLEKLRRII